MPERTARVFTSFGAAEQSDAEYYAGLMPQQCLEIHLDLIAAYRAAR